MPGDVVCGRQSPHDSLNAHTLNMPLRAAPNLQNLPNASENILNSWLETAAQQGMEGVLLRRILHQQMQRKTGALVLAGFSLIVGRDNGPDVGADDLLDGEELWLFGFFCKLPVFL